MATHVEQTKTMENNKFDENFQLISEKYLKVYIQYADKIKMHEERFKNMNPDPRSFEDITDKRLKVFPVQISSQKYEGIKFELPPITTYDSELDRAEVEAYYASQTLELANALKMGLKIKTERIIHNLIVTEENLSEQLDLNFPKLEMEKTDWLETELCLSHAIDFLKISLGIEKAYSGVALQILNKILNMNTDALMLKKNPKYYEVFLHLKRYTGNLSAWDLSPSEEEKFIEDAKKIRDLSIRVLKKFENLFEYSSAVNFMDEFQKDCKQFESSIQKLSLREVFTLHVEPYTRTYFLDQIINYIK